MTPSSSRRITVPLILLLAGAAIHDLTTSSAAREAFAAYAPSH